MSMSAIPPVPVLKLDFSILFNQLRSLGSYCTSSFNAFLALETIFGFNEASIYSTLSDIFFQYNLLNADLT